MNALRRIAWAVGVVVVANAISYQVLVHNQRAHVYSPEADTILIPIVENAAISAVLVVLLIAGVLCARGPRVALWTGFVLNVLATLLAALLSVQWFVPDHYLIASAFGFVLFTSVWITYVSVRRPASNSTPHTDARANPVLPQSPPARAGERGR
jgi:hypothetical protein